MNDIEKLVADLLEDLSELEAELETEMDSYARGGIRKEIERIENRLLRIERGEE